MIKSILCQFFRNKNLCKLKILRKLKSQKLRTSAERILSKLIIANYNLMSIANKNSKKYFAKIAPIIILLVILFLPTFVSAAWWNPFSWNIWQRIASIFHKQEIAQVQQDNKENKENGQENALEQKTKNDKLLLDDVYPLFGDLKWSPVTPKKAEGSDPIDGLEIKAQSSVNSGVQDAEKFFDYYKNKLANLGWQDDWGFSADGVLGSQIGFKKGNDKIVLGYQVKPGKVTSSENEPLQFTCPCPVTYSVFTTAKTDETAGWKTYTNTEYGFEIKYPQDWSYSISDEVLNIYCDYKNRGIENPCQGLKGVGIADVGPGIDIKIDKISLQDYIKRYNKEGEFFGSKIIKQEKFLIGNIEGQRLVGTTAIGLDLSIIFLTINDNSYIINFYKHAPIQEKIISTFKFIK